MLAMLWLKLKRMRSDMPLYAIMIVMALVLSMIFGSAMNGGSPRVNITDNDRSAFSQKFIEGLADSYELDHTNRLGAKRAVEKGESIAAIILPEGFGSAAENGEARLNIIRVTNSADVTALENSVRSAYRAAAREHRLYGAMQTAFANAGLSAPSPESVREALENDGGIPLITVSFSVAQTGRYNEVFASNMHYLLGYNIFFVMFSIIFTMGALLEDKKLRTWERIRISPVSPAAVLAGHLLPAYIAGVLQMGIVLFAGQALFGYNLGARLLPVFAVFAVYVLCIVCLGLLLAAGLKTIDQLGSVTPVIAVASSMLGGCMWPLSIIDSKALLAAANITPQKWAVEAAESLTVYGADFKDVLLNVIILFGMAVVFFSASVLLYSKKQKA
ncbi:MAG: ABC transporter permease [Christensenellales bacterium]